MNDERTYHKMSELSNGDLNVLIDNGKSRNCLTAKALYGRTRRDRYGSIAMNSSFRFPDVVTVVVTIVVVEMSSSHPSSSPVRRPISYI